MKRALSVTAFFGGLILLWKVATMVMGWSPLLLPPPEAVARYLWDALHDGTLLSASIVTVKRLLLGYFIGVAIGMGLGLMVSTSDFFDSTVGALALGLQTLPSVCWVPLALLWFGQTEGAMLFVVIMGTVGSVVIATSNGTLSIPPIYTRVALTRGSEGFDQWSRVIVPAALTFLVSGM
jgi:NitT/TauT family transport system permease protein